jgi:hypothetical protein
MWRCRGGPAAALREAASCNVRTMCCNQSMARCQSLGDRRATEPYINTLTLSLAGCGVGLLPFNLFVHSLFFARAGGGGGRLDRLTMSCFPVNAFGSRDWSMRPHLYDSEPPR